MRKIVDFSLDPDRELISELSRSVLGMVRDDITLACPLATDAEKAHLAAVVLRSAADEAEAEERATPAG